MMPILLIPLLPLLGFLIVGIFWPYFKGKGHFVALPLVTASWAIATVEFFKSFSAPPSLTLVYDWIRSGHLDVGISLQYDHLAAVMLFMVTTVAMLVHLYTIGYMHGDSGYDRFFAYISLFTFSMIMLVLSDNLVEMFIFWEAVGLCSYLLIVHWYERRPSWLAANKAFIMNRVGDFGFLLGIFLAYTVFGSVRFAEIFPAIGSHLHETVNLASVFHGSWNVPVLDVIALLLFLGAVGKSAQIPLHPWLPDAMEGPTPISALIHAATMVTAGVFMIARMNPLYNAAPFALHVVAWTGAITAIVAATIALTQPDIKKIVAYSTMSQLGYMVMVCGLGGYGAGIFHLLTHGAFKALLFLGAGSVIHSLSGEQDVFRMGGLRKYVGLTFATMLIGSLALSGIPPFAGYYSKDLILVTAYQQGPLGQMLWLIGVLTAVLTAFYSFRLLFLVFGGKERFHSEGHGHAVHPHESPLTMTIPLLVLSIATVFAGWAGEHYGILQYLSQELPLPHVQETSGGFSENALKGLSVAGALFGILIAWALYGKESSVPAALARNLSFFYKISLHKWYFDELYDALFVRPSFAIGRLFWQEIDKGVIDGVVNGVAHFFRNSGGGLRRLQSGQIQNYAMAMAIGAFGLVAFYLFFNRL